MKRALLGLALAMVVATLAGGCSDDKPAAATAGSTNSEEVLKRDCADPKWRDQNLGLWYSVCRPPLRF